MSIREFVLKAAWIPTSKPKRPKGQWHSWLTEQFNFYNVSPVLIRIR